MKSINVLQPAEHEVFDASAYYELQVAGLGSAFLDQFNVAIEDIAKNPERWPLMAFNVRRRLIRRFPYAILYRIDPDEVVILAVSHLRRRPWYWIDRI